MAGKNGKRGRLTSFVGTVARSSGEKTAVVDVETTKKHPVYNRSIKKRVRYVVHDGKNQCEAGNEVVIYESKPVSKTKRWRVGKVVKAGSAASSDGGVQK